MSQITLVQQVTALPNDKNHSMFNAQNHFFAILKVLKQNKDIEDLTLSVDDVHYIYQYCIFYEMENKEKREILDMENILIASRESENSWHILTDDLQLLYFKGSEQQLRHHGISKEFRSTEFDNY